MNISISEAKAKFAELIRRVEAGENITLTRNGKPVAQLSEPLPQVSDAARRRASVGKYAGKVRVAPDFDTLGPEWADYQ